MTLKAGVWRVWRFIMMIKLIAQLRIFTLFYSYRLLAKRGKATAKNGKATARAGLLKKGKATAKSPVSQRLAGLF
jgi:hypothetical protein